jgi:predicted dehydrogenase
MTRKRARIALVGAGHVAQVAHIPAYLRNPNVELVAVVDEDPVKARRIRKQFGVAEWYEDFAEMLHGADVDAVDICTPNYLHAPMTVAALRSGRDVLCEKPLARNLEEAQRMVDTAEEHGRLLMAAMNHRYREDVRVLRRLIRAREMGNVNFVKAGWLRNAGEWKERQWFTERTKAGGGALLDLGTALVDLAIWVADLRKPSGVLCSVYGKKGRGGVEHSACALVRFSGGSALMLEVSWNLREPRTQTYLHVYGGGGAAMLNPLKVHKDVQGVLVNVTPAIEPSGHHYYKESYRLEIEHFADCVLNRKIPATAGREVLTIHRIVDAMYESAASGREVPLDQ